MNSSNLPFNALWPTLSPARPRCWPASREAELTWDRCPLTSQCPSPNCLEEEASEYRAPNCPPSWESEGTSHLPGSTHWQVALVSTEPVPQPQALAPGAAHTLTPFGPLEWCPEEQAAQTGFVFFFCLALGFPLLFFSFYIFKSLFFSPPIWPPLLVQ